LSQLGGHTTMFGGGEDAMMGYIATRVIYFASGIEKG
jgi:hypothetical protein